jgi:hypothetical protein
MTFTAAPYARSVTTARTRAHLRGQVHPGLMSTMVVAVVLGILGMHGFDPHGVTGHSSHTGPTASTTHTSHAGHAASFMGEAAMATSVHLSLPATAERAVASAFEPGDASGTGGMDAMVMLCVAMLAGAAAGLLVLALRRGALARVRRFDLLLGGAQGVPTPLRVGTGPPALWRFSVIRC